jgi:hypothetical protein
MVIPKERKRRATLRIERNEYNRRQAAESGDALGATFTTLERQT